MNRAQGIVGISVLLQVNICWLVLCISTIISKHSDFEYIEIVISFCMHLILILYVIFQKGELSNAELRILTEELNRIRYGDNEARIKHISIRGLLPETPHFMTYEGSTTAPGCHETVTWIVLNKPIYITLQQVRNFFNSIHFNGSSIIRRNISLTHREREENVKLPCQRFQWSQVILIEENKKAWILFYFYLFWYLFDRNARFSQLFQAIHRWNVIFSLSMQCKYTSLRWINNKYCINVPCTVCFFFGGTQNK